MTPQSQRDEWRRHGYSPQERALFDKHVPTTRPQRPDWTVCAHDSMTWPCETEKARELLAAARTAIPALLDDVERLTAALAFIADWAHDCSPSNGPDGGSHPDPKLYGFDAIEDRARAALAASDEASGHA